MIVDVPAPETDLASCFALHRRSLWSLAYRMLGTASEAEDAVQDAWLTALERPPKDRSRPWRPWLVRVLMNDCRDRLRRRRRRAYPGPWLPSPLDTSDPDTWALAPLFPARDDAPDARFDRLESVTLAFLVALEALTPQQRAVLLLRDVCDCSVQETAELLELGVSNVKVTHHRARRALRSYEEARVRPDDALRAETLSLLARFAAALGTGDLEAVRAVVAEDVEVRADGGGERRAAARVFGGRDVVAKLYLGLSARTGTPQVEVVERNGLPALRLFMPDAPPPWPTESVMAVLPNARGDLWRLWSVTTPTKLGAG